VTVQPVARAYVLMRFDLADLMTLPDASGKSSSASGGGGGGSSSSASGAGPGSGSIGGAGAGSVFPAPKSVTLHATEGDPSAVGERHWQHKAKNIVLPAKVWLRLEAQSVFV
jgi:hypothetical protein